MAHLLIGGKSVIIRKLKFKALKRVWPLLEKAQTSDDPMEQIDATMQIVHASYIRDHGDVPFEDFEDMFESDEAIKLATTLQELMEESGLIPKGNPQMEAPVEATPESLSTETSTESSQSLSPQE